MLQKRPRRMGEVLRHYTCRECGQTVATDRELRSYRCDCGGEMVFVGPFSIAEVDQFRLAWSAGISVAVPTHGCPAGRAY